VQRAARGPHASADRPGAENLPAEQDQDADQELIKAERHAALREAFTHLPADGQQLIALLIADPPLPYAEISARLGIPVGSIGPTRSRCLDQMRRHPAIAALINADRGADYRADRGTDYRAEFGRNRGAGRCVQRSVIAAGVGR